MVENDTPAFLIHLLKLSPWIRPLSFETKEENSFGFVEIFENGEWKKKKKANFDSSSSSLNVLEVQIWLTLTNLLCKKEFASCYEYDQRKQSKVLELRELLEKENSSLKSLIPIETLQRYLVQLQLSKVPEKLQNSTTATGVNNGGKNKIVEITNLSEKLITDFNSWKKSNESKRYFLENLLSNSNDKTKYETAKK